MLYLLEEKGSASTVARTRPLVHYLGSNGLSSSPWASNGTESQAVSRHLVTCTATLRQAYTCDVSRHWNTSEPGFSICPSISEDRFIVSVQGLSCRLSVQCCQGVTVTCWLTALVPAGTVETTALELHYAEPRKHSMEDGA